MSRLGTSDGEVIHEQLLPKYLEQSIFSLPMPSDNVYSSATHSSIHLVTYVCINPPTLPSPL